MRVANQELVDEVNYLDENHPQFKINKEDRDEKDATQIILSKIHKREKQVYLWSNSGNLYIYDDSLTMVKKTRLQYPQIIAADYLKDHWVLVDQDGGIHFTNSEFESYYDFHISQPIKSIHLINEEESFISFEDNNMIHFDKSKFFDWKKDYRNKQILYWNQKRKLAVIFEDCSVCDICIWKNRSF